jgi:hypothetical protein
MGGVRLIWGMRCFLHHIGKCYKIYTIQKISIMAKIIVDVVYQARYGHFIET